MAKKSILPRVHVMVLCDDVAEREDAAAAFDLIGVRTHIVAPAFPYEHPQLWVYLQVTGHESTAEGRVVIYDSDDNEIATSQSQFVTFTGPLDFLHLFFPFADCTFSGPGVYYVQVKFDGKIVGERALHLIEEEGGSNGQAD